MHSLDEYPDESVMRDEDIEEFSRQYGDKWRKLPAHLGLRTIVATDVDALSMKEDGKRHEFFTVWKQRRGRQATYKKLFDALNKIQCVEDAEALYEIWQNSRKVSF